MEKRGEKPGKHNRVSAAHIEVAAVFDGMVTVEIPVQGEQVVAYEPLPNMDDDAGITLLDPDEPTC